MRYILIIWLLLFSSSWTRTQILFQDEHGTRHPRSFDVLHYKLDLSFNEARKEVSGIAHITLTPLVDRLDSIVLHAIRMNIDSVGSQSDLPVSYRSDSTLLTLTFSDPPHTFDTIAISIQYSCSPKEGLYFIQPDSSDLTRRWQFWTQGEESENRHWFPSYDSPDDKATSEVIATVRDSYVVLSNGNLVSETRDTVNGTRTFHWRQEKPHSSYLIMLAAGEYDILRDDGGRIPISNYVPSGEAAKGLVSFRNTRQILEGIEKIVGYPYPWTKYSQIIIHDFMWGGMENTSAVTLNEAYLYDERTALEFSADAVIAHEVAHQWWGDLLTCRDWSHLWLQEGFANYYEALYKRSQNGFDEYQYEAYQWAKSIRSLDETAGRKPVVSNESFSINLYQRGGWILRMLANLLGEENLLNYLSQYAKRHEFEAVTTEDLISALEDFSGKDLRWFFDQWVYGTGYPSLDVTTDWDDDGSVLRVTVNQVQETDSLTDLFAFPLDIEVTTATGKHLSKIWVSEREETFVLPLDEKPLMMIFDKGLNVLKSLNQGKTKSEYLYQLANASEAIDRLDACQGLSTFKEDDEVFDAFRKAARNDPFWAVRVKALNTLVDMEMDEDMEVVTEFYNDSDPRVRSAAIAALGKHETPEAALFLERVAVEDSVYSVLSSCIRTLARVDSARGFQLAARTVEMDSYRDMIRVASLNALRTLKTASSIPIALRYLGPSYETGTRVIAAGILADNGQANSEARETIARLVSDSNRRMRLAAIQALDAWDGAESEKILKERVVQESDSGVREAIERALSEEKTE